MKKAFILLTAILIGINLAAFETVIKVDKNAWQTKQQADGYPVTLQTGEPVLPYVPVNVLIPFGQRYQNASIQLAPALWQKE